MNEAPVICPLCKDPVDRILYRFHLEGERFVLNEIRRQNPAWTEGDGLCSRCFDYYQVQVLYSQQCLPAIGPYFPVRSADDFVILPTAYRISAMQDYTGENITICFIDSGFYHHPDLTKINNRIIGFVDVTVDEQDPKHFFSNGAESWHGTMTSVVCAGDGCLSNGLYKAIAHKANLVMIKVQDKDGNITPESVCKAFKWAVAHREQFNIKIINISLGIGQEPSQKNQSLNIAAEHAIAEGIVVIAAVGNDPNGRLQQPASAPNVIAVGGINDNNDPQLKEKSLYHFTSGSLEGGICKPDLLAPSIWIAAPILPGTNEHREATVLHKLLAMDDERLAIEIPALIASTQLDPSIINKPVVEIKIAIRQRVQSAKYISADYMHVDGTSFAAPIVASVVAQLLQIQPQLNPAAVRNILLQSSRRLPHFPAEQQGFGVLDPRKAVLTVLNFPPEQIPIQPIVDSTQKVISFKIQHQSAEQVALAGSFNNWDNKTLLLEPGKNATWSIQIPLLPQGDYSYKFFINDQEWLEDANNPRRAFDGFNGFNSLFSIKSNNHDSN